MASSAAAAAAASSAIAPSAGAGSGSGRALRDAFEDGLAIPLGSEPVDWAAVVELCNDFELDAAAWEPTAEEVSGSADASAPLPAYALHLCALLATGDVENARFLWKRVPAAIKRSDPELSAVWAVGTAMWKRDYAAVYAAASSGKFSDATSSHVGGVVTAFRERTAALIERAFTSVSVANASRFLGLDAAATSALATSRKWTVDGSDLIPVRAAAAVPQAVDQADLEALTRYVTFLEGQTVSSH